MRHLIACAGALSLALLVPAAASAAEAQVVTCKDGSTSHAGRGACSHHGGIARVQALPAGQPSARPGPAAAPAPSLSAQRVTCKDGSLSTAGRGACSHHGGVAGPSAAAPAPATPRATQLPQRQVTPAAPVAAPPLPGKATARCRDGTFSYSAHHTGTCSHHGGVSQWL